MGYCGWISVLTPLLPADATKRIPASPCWRISVPKVTDRPPPPQLLLVTITSACPPGPPKNARVLRINSAHWTASAVEPLPDAPRNLQRMMLTFQFTPATPISLFPAAPIVPDVCEP